MYQRMSDPEADARSIMMRQPCICNGERTGSEYVTKRDVPVVQACGLVFAAFYIGLNLIADIVAIVSNPRLRHPK